MGLVVFELIRGDKKYFMKLKKKHIIIGILLICIVLTLGKRLVDMYYYNCINGREPIKTIKSSIGLELPKSAEIVEYNYRKELGEYQVKIKLNSDDIEEVQIGLIKFFESEYTKSINNETITIFTHYNDWWDLRCDEIETAYIRWTSIHGPKGSNWEHGHMTIENGAFITKDTSGQHYLYISSALEIEDK